MSKMFEEFELSIGSFRQDRCGERFHYLLHSHRLAGQLVFGRAISSQQVEPLSEEPFYSPYQTKSTHANGLQICVPDCRSISVDPVRNQGPSIPTSDLESRSEDLGPHKLGHLVQRVGVYNVSRLTA